MSDTKRRKRFFSMPAIDQPDPEPGFQHSSDEFDIPATDEDGTSTRCQFRCPGTLAGWMSDIVASKKFPFVREGDLMRYGAYLACIQLSRIDLSVPNVQGEIDAIAQLVRRREQAARITNHVDHLAKVVTDLQAKGAWGEIVYLLAAERRSAEKMTGSEPYWSKYWLEALHDRLSSIEQKAISRLDTINLLPQRPPSESELRED